MIHIRHRISEMSMAIWYAALLALLVFGGLAIVACADDDDDAPTDDDDNSADDDNDNDNDDNNDDNDNDNNDNDDTSPIDDDDNDDTVGEVWTDSISDLAWQNGDAKDLNWAQAKSHCENLDWGGFTDWRLPTVSELRSLIRECANTATGGACGVTDECLAYMTCWNPTCNGCGWNGGPGPGGRYWPAELTGEGWIYWAFQQVEENPDTAWRVHFYNGLVSYNDAQYIYAARCVR